MPASISSKTSVSPPATAASARATRESSPPEAVSDTGPKGQTRVRADEKDGLVHPGGARLALTQLDEELSVSHPELAELLGDRLGEPLDVRTSHRPELLGESADTGLRCRNSVRSSRDRVLSCSRLLELTSGVGRSLEELAERRRRETALQLGDPSEAALDLFEGAWFRLQRREEAVQVASDLTETNGDVAKLGSCFSELRRDALERRQRALRARRERGRAVPFVGRDRLGSGHGDLLQLRRMTKSLALHLERVLVPRLESFGVLDERLELGEPRRDSVGVTREFLIAATCSRQVLPRGRRIAPPLGLLDTAERVEHVELEGRPGKAALLELARHREQPLGGRGDVFARDRATPGIRARPPVTEDPPREHEPGLAFGSQLGERGHVLLVEERVRDVELCLHVGLGAVGAHGGRVGARAEQQADRLREDRLTRPGLAGDRVEPRTEREIRLADQHEVLDPEPTKQGAPLYTPHRKAPHNGAFPRVDVYSSS